MKPNTENPRSLFKWIRGQRKSTNVNIISFYAICMILMVIFTSPLSDGKAATQSIEKSMRILSCEEDNSVEESNHNTAGDISIATAGYIEPLATENVKGNQFNETLKTSNVATGSAIIFPAKNNSFDSTIFRAMSVSSQAIETQEIVESYVPPSVVETPTPVVQEEVIKEYKMKHTRYIKASCGLNVRSEPSKKSKVLKTLKFGTKIKCAIYDKDWVVIKIKKKKGFEYGYLSREYLTKTRPKFTYKSVSGDRRKSYMDWTAITTKSSPQYKLQQKATTASNGVRMVNGRYCIAVGSYFTTDIGRVVDVLLENGTVIPCVLGDAKAQKDTNSTHAIGNDGSVGEFIVSTSHLNHKTRQMGDVCYASVGWDSPIIGIRIYNKNLLRD